MYPPNIFMPHISETNYRFLFSIFFFWSSLHFGHKIGHPGGDDLFFWSSLHFGQEIGHLGSDDLFFGFHFIAHHSVVGKTLGNRAGVSD